jgi:glutathione S-transferase
MKLYYAETLNPRKACAVAKYLNTEVDFVHVDLARGENRTPEFLALNPNGKVPVLELESGRGALWESNAIMCHLARIAGSDLWPGDERQVEVMRWLSWDSQHFTRHAGSLYFEHVIKPAIGLGRPDPSAVAEAEGFFKRFAAVLEAHLSGRRWLVGETLTIADFAVAVTLPYAGPAHLPLDGLDEIQRWHAQLNALPAWREPFPSAEAAASPQVSSDAAA